MATLSEQGVYFFLARSDKPKALPFQMWLAGDLLPTYRKHGAAISPQKIEDILTDPDTLIRLATDLKAERAQRVQAEQKALALTEQIHADRPKVLFASSVEASVTTAKSEQIQLL